MTELSEIGGELLRVEPESLYVPDNEPVTDVAEEPSADDLPVEFLLKM